MTDDIAAPPRRRGRPPKNRISLNQQDSRGFGYRLRKAGDKGFASLTVPKGLADQIPEGTRFQPELTDEGLLYRPVRQPQREVIAPDWTRLG